MVWGNPRPGNVREFSQSGLVMWEAAHLKCNPLVQPVHWRCSSWCLHWAGCAPSAEQCGAVQVPVRVLVVRCTTYLLVLGFRPRPFHCRTSAHVLLSWMRYFGWDFLMSSLFYSSIFRFLISLSNPLRPASRPWPHPHPPMLPSSFLLFFTRWFLWNFWAQKSSCRNSPYILSISYAQHHPYQWLKML